MEAKFRNLKELLQEFSHEKNCRKFLENQLWSGTPTCPKCGGQKSYALKDGKTYKCANNQCYRTYTVTVGTVFENTNIKLSTWFAAMYLCTAHKKGISSLQLSRDLGITQKTAWFLLHRIRKMMKEKAPYLLTTTQVDETFVSGKTVNKHKSKKVYDADGKLVLDQTAVIGAYSKDDGVRTETINSVNKENASQFIEKNIEQGSTLVTDSEKSYYQVGKKYNHQVVNHSVGQYVRNGFHTNGIENFWSMLKRGVYGIYHQVSRQHLQRYCDEFSYRYNFRKMTDADRFTMVFKNATGHMTYQSLISSNI